MGTLKEKLSRLLWGSQAGQAEHIVARWAFIRALGIVYLIAFISVWVQADGLFGEQGILPVQDFLDGVRQNNLSNYYQVCPTLFWFGCSNTAVHLVCAVGTVAAVLMAAGILPCLGGILAWVCYLSLNNAGQDFFAYQWDGLLLEAGFLAIFLAPTSLFLTLSRDEKPSRIVVWLVRWLCFRLIFSSGLVKLTCGDRTWRDCTAMTYHYCTQPLPTWTAWYMHQAPVGFQKFTTFLVLAIELAVPFTIFAPRRVRHPGAYILIGFQLLLILTGNYCFFNLLTIVLCIPLFDDTAFPARWRNAVPPAAEPAPMAPMARRGLFANRRTVFLGLVACALVPLTLLAALENADVLDRDKMTERWPHVQGVMVTGLRFHCIGYYGLFRSMTVRRPEIVLEGSNDGEKWLEYDFKYKPGDLTRRPAFVAPYQPRLDWQMWFAALSNRQAPDWFLPFIKRLLEGSPPVLSLLEKNPFPDTPPKFIRAVLYEYNFTARAGSEGAWWKRKQLGLYMKDISLDEFYYGPKQEGGQ